MMTDGGPVTSAFQSIFKYHLLSGQYTLDDVKSMTNNSQIETFLSDSNISLLHANSIDKIILKGMEEGQAEIIEEVNSSCAASIFIINNLLLPVLPQSLYRTIANTSEVYTEETSHRQFQSGISTMKELNRLLWETINSDNITNQDTAQTNEQQTLQQNNSENNMQILVQYIEQRLGDKTVPADETDMNDANKSSQDNNYDTTVPFLEDLQPITIVIDDQRVHASYRSNDNQQNEPNTENDAEKDRKENNRQLPPVAEMSEAYQYGILETSNQQGLQPLSLVKSPDFQWWRENMIKAPPPPPPSPPQVEVPDWDVHDLVSFGIQLGSPVLVMENDVIPLSPQLEMLKQVVTQQKEDSSNSSGQIVAYTAPLQSEVLAMPMPPALDDEIKDNGHNEDFLPEEEDGNADDIGEILPILSQNYPISELISSPTLQKVLDRTNMTLASSPTVAANQLYSFASTTLQVYSDGIYTPDGIYIADASNGIFPAISLSSYQQDSSQQQPLNQPFTVSSTAGLGSQFQQGLPNTTTYSVLETISQFNGSAPLGTSSPPPPSIDTSEQLVEGFTDILAQFLPPTSPMIFPFEPLYDTSQDVQQNPQNMQQSYLIESQNTSITVQQLPADVQFRCENISALDIISQNSELSVLRLAIVYNEMESYLSDDQKPLTIFAPSNNAFAELSTLYNDGRLPNSNPTSSNVLQNSDIMNTILGYHVVPALALQYEKLLNVGEEELGTMGQQSISLVPWQDIVLLKGVGNNAAIVERDVGNSCNVALHIIDSVLLPFPMQGEVTSSMRFANNLQRSATSLVPSYPRSSQTLDSQTVAVDADSNSRNCSPLIQMLSQQPELALYHQLLEDSGLSELIRDRTDLTVFAPADAALGRVMDAISSSGGISQDTMQLMLAYHIVQGDWHTDALINGIKLQTITSDSDGVPFQLVVQRNGASTIIHGLSNSVQIEGPNRYACGSMIHIVNDVLIPVQI
eukprot:TRINITY_DN3100_c0_g1_i11.p1 TRINITY_DN3100_c0_g1~~TRINITY_DN3100_c0_g1_i11.p1  ORF type:complete len:1058 (-),score=107.48 TRINITY_DN3100_c0_g1_i11:2801-5722(-)